MSTGTLVECRGGPLDGQRISPPKQLPSAVLYVPEAAPNDGRAGNYLLREPEDAAPYYEWQGEA